MPIPMNVFVKAEHLSSFPYTSFVDLPRPLYPFTVRKNFISWARIRFSVFFVVIRASRGTEIVFQILITEIHSSKFCLHGSFFFTNCPYYKRRLFHSLDNLSGWSALVYSCHWQSWFKFSLYQYMLSSWFSVDIVILYPSHLSLIHI